MARKYQQGRYRLLHPEKYVGNANDVVYRSSWELRFNRWCDLNPSVVKWNSEEIVIPYYSSAEFKNRRYFVDYIVQLKMADGSLKTLLIEIKPESQTIAPVKGRKKPERYLQECITYQVNQDKWTAARAYAAKHGMEFRVMTEYDLGIAKRK
ncbi:head completion protein [Xanthomonas phage BUDD]|nr:head completion protein [Xanthomonas phage BUDD]